MRKCAVHPLSARGIAQPVGISADSFCKPDIKGAIAWKQQCFEKMAQKSKPAFHWLIIRYRNALVHCARSYSHADA